MFGGKRRLLKLASAKLVKLHTISARIEVDGRFSEKMTVRRLSVCRCVTGEGESALCWIARRFRLPCVGLRVSLVHVKSTQANEEIEEMNEMKRSKKKLI